MNRLVGTIDDWLAELCALSVGAVKYPTFSAANSGASPVMKTAEHMIFANPAV